MLLLYSWQNLTQTSSLHLLEEIQAEFLENVQWRRQKVVAQFINEESNFQNDFCWMSACACVREDTNQRIRPRDCQLGDSSFLKCSNSIASTHLDIIFMKVAFAGHLHCISEQEMK